MTDQSSSHTTKVLLVDDNDLQRKLTRTVLASSGFATVDARSGADGLKILAGEQVDVIVCDMRMPLMSGREFTLEVRKQADFQKIPIIILTAEESEISDPPESFGANAICDKVKLLSTLVNQIRAVLSSTKA